MKKKLVITTLSLCMILAAAPAQAFAGTTASCQNGTSAGTTVSCQNGLAGCQNGATTTVLGKLLNSCGSYSGCQSAFEKVCASLQWPGCNDGSDCTPNDGSDNDAVNNGSNSLNSWQSQIQDYLNKYMGGGNTGATGDNDADNNADNDAAETPSVEQNNSNGNSSNNANNNNTANNNGTVNNNTESSGQAGSGAAVGSYEKQVADIVNKERAAAGLSSLKLDSKLSAVAEKKAEDMRDKGYFSHTSPTYGSPFEMMTQFGIKYSAAGENIAKGQKTPSSVMNAWMNSSGHKANILNSNFENIGVGYVTDSNGTTYWVQMFTK